MPSTIGHAIAGAAVAWTADAIGARPTPGRDSHRSPSAPVARSAPTAAMAFTCMAIAAAPDLDLLFQTHRTMTHSFGATIVVALLAAAIAANARLPVVRVALVCAAAHASHIVLDWLAVDTTPPYGIQALWPASHEWFISGIGAFRGTAREHFFSRDSIRENALAVAQEIAILAPMAWAAWLVRVKTLARLATEVPGRDHPPE
jgi:membrane-bound metal-dependent hydrolase YbcI (DUF457 family)